MLHALSQFYPEGIKYFMIDACANDNRSSAFSHIELFFEH